MSIHDCSVTILTFILNGQEKVQEEKCIVYGKASHGPKHCVFRPHKASSAHTNLAKSDSKHNNV